MNNLLKKIKTKIIEKSKDHLIIFVHGIAGTFQDWKILLNKTAENNHRDVRFGDEKKIICQGFNSVINYSYYTKNFIYEAMLGNLTLYAKRFQKLVHHAVKITNKSKIIIIAHSMGGLVARKYMTLSPNNWESVYKIVTLGTPNLGVPFSFSFGQTKDLGMQSKFIINLNSSWDKFYKDSAKKWGVVGGIDKESALNIFLDVKDKTDSGGPGYIRISSAIPYDEWKDAESNFEMEDCNTAHFGFRLAVNANHQKLLYCFQSLKGVLWALE